MKDWKLVIVFVALLFATSTSAQEKVVIGGTGGMRDAMKDASKVYMAKKPGDVIEVLEEHVSNSGGIEATKGGRLTIGLVSRAPRDNEKGGLIYRALGRTPVAVAVNKLNGVGNISESHLCDVYSGRIKNWSEVGGANVKVTLLVRNRADGYLELLQKKVACFRDVKITSDAVPMNRGGELLDALNGRPGTIGSTSYNSDRKDRPNIRNLAIAGLEPSLEAIQKGKYPYAVEAGVVTLGEPKGAGQRFLDFLSTPEALKILARYDVVPLR